MSDYQKICQELLKDLPTKQQEVILRRFGLGEREKETLESIGKSFGLTRERVRQIEKKGLEAIKTKAAQYKEVFENFQNYLKKQGGFKKEEVLLSDLGGEKQKPEVFFLLKVSEMFQRANESEDFYPFWAIGSNSLEFAKKNLELAFKKLKEIGHPLSLKELNSLLFSDRPNSFLVNCLEISKNILSNQEGLYGLKTWPEVNPRGARDKAYLVFKKLKKPLHFSKVAKLIDGALVPTVHNELIKDPRFVLVGRGVYALREWGYEPGQVKDIIKKVLKENGPLTKEEILERVRQQRMVKESTILLNLSNKNYFLKDSKGRYIVKEI